MVRCQFPRLHLLLCSLNHSGHILHISLQKLNSLRLLFLVIVVSLVSQATPFTERGRVWSRCNYRVVAEGRNYQPLQLGNP